MQTETIQLLLESLFIEKLGFEVLRFQPIKNSGSERMYFRVFTHHNSFIASYNNNVAENRAFFHIADSFDQAGIPKPKLLAVSNCEKACIQEDLGDESLFDRIMLHRQDEHFTEIIRPLFHQALDILVELQIEVDKTVDYGLCWPSGFFDQRSILSDLHYFYYYFVKQQPNLEINEYKLLAELEALSLQIATIPLNCFIYRDFQSRNLMIKNNQLYCIDFQGGRKGNFAYDVVSFLYQVKAGLPAGFKEEMIDYYSRKLNFKGFNTSEFRQHLSAFIYLRLFQVLGAYGFRGIIQRKQHFLESIPFALRQLENHLLENPLPLELPALESLLRQLAKSNENQSSKRIQAEKKLKIKISSFSYIKGGIPVDGSGNGGGFVFDCRILPNPGREEKFRNQTGLDQEVIDYLKAKPEVNEFLSNVQLIVKQGVENYLYRGFTDLMVSFGCTGGQHRSVYCASMLTEWLKGNFDELNIETEHIEQGIKLYHG